MLALVVCLDSARGGVRRALEALAELAADVDQEKVFYVDDVAVYRLVRVFAKGYERLSAHPVPKVSLPVALGMRRRALATAAALIRAGPETLVMSYHRRWSPRLLLG